MGRPKRRCQSRHVEPVFQRPNVRLEREFGHRERLADEVARALECAALPVLRGVVAGEEYDGSAVVLGQAADGGAHVEAVHVGQADVEEDDVAVVVLERVERGAGVGAADGADGLRRFGYSRDKRSDCVQVVIALIVTPEGFPLAHEVLPGNTTDKSTLRDFLQKIETQYGRARRVWVMDRGIPTEEVLEEMRQAGGPPVEYLVGTPKGRLGKLEAELLKQPWQQAREGVRVKLLPQDGEL